MAAPGVRIMTVGILVDVVVPAALVVLMTTVGLNLSLLSIGEILRHPRSLFLSTALQVVLLPAVALAIISVLKPDPVVALVILAISVSPGGVLSNAFTHLVGGNLALSVLMTTLTTLLVSVLAPVALAVAAASGVLETAVAARLDPLSVGYDLLRFAFLPICAGLICARALPNALSVLRRAMDALSVAAVLVVLTCSLVVSWPLLPQVASETLVLAVVFSVASLGAGAAAARLLPAEDRSACIIEFAVRNLPVALVLASGSTASAETVAFLLCYFIVNTTFLIALSLLRRKSFGTGA